MFSLWEMILYNATNKQRVPCGSGWDTNGQYLTRSGRMNRRDRVTGLLIWLAARQWGSVFPAFPCNRVCETYLSWTLCTLLNHKATKSLLISDAALIMRCLSVFVCLVKHRCHSASSLSCCHCYLWNHRCSHLPVKPFVCLTSVENCSVTFSVCYDCFVFKQFEHSGSLWRVSFCAFHIIILCNRSVCAGFLINLHIKESVWLWMTGCYGCLDFTHFTGLIMFGGIPS